MKMPPKVFSREMFSEAMNYNHLSDESIEGKIGKLAVISITGNIDQEDHYFKKNHPNVLNIRFDDIEADEINIHIFGGEPMIAKGISEEQASELLDFILKNKDAKFVIHCQAGVSRSAAVGRFIVDLFDMDYHWFREINPIIHPNERVLSLLKYEARKRELI